MISVGGVNGSLESWKKLMMKLVHTNVLLKSWEQDMYFFNYSDDGMLAYTVFPLESSASKPSVRNKIRLSEGIV